MFSKWNLVDGEAERSSVAFDKRRCYGHYLVGLLLLLKRLDRRRCLIQGGTDLSLLTGEMLRGVIAVESARCLDRRLPLYHGVAVDVLHDWILD